MKDNSLPSLDNVYQNDESFSSKEFVSSGLLIRQHVIVLREFKSRTLRTNTFSNEKCVLLQTKCPSSLGYLGIFVLEEDTQPTHRSNTELGHHLDISHVKLSVITLSKGEADEKNI